MLYNDNDLDDALDDVFSYIANRDIREFWRLDFRAIYARNASNLATKRLFYKRFLLSVLLDFLPARADIRHDLIDIENNLLNHIMLKIVPVLETIR